MKEVFYEWIRNMVFYQLLMTIVMQMLPNDTYQKYIRFFLGMLFIVIAIQPVFRILNLEEEIDIGYVQKMWEKEQSENEIDLGLGEIGIEDENIP